MFFVIIMASLAISVSIIRDREALFALPNGIPSVSTLKSIVKKIVNDNKADYVINLKGNQETLQQEVKDYFEELEQSGELETIKQQAGQEDVKSTRKREGIQVNSTLDKGHGRIEKRTYYYATDLDRMVDARRTGKS